MIELTVCMPVYNSERYLDESIGSILSQTYRNFKLLIYDDGSTDGTVEKIKSFNDERIVLMKGNENRGPVYARTQIINALDTEYCMWCDSDDRFCRNDALEYAVNYIKSGDYDLVNFTNVYYLSKEKGRGVRKNFTYGDFIYCGDQLFEKFYPVDNHELFWSKIFKTELMKKSIPSHYAFEQRFVTDDHFFCPMWFYACKRYLQLVSNEPIYEYKNDIGYYGKDADDFTPQRFGDLCVCTFFSFLSNYEDLNAIKPMNEKEYDAFMKGKNFNILIKIINVMRERVGEAYGNALMDIFHSAFGRDGVHLLNGINDFVMEGTIRQMNDDMGYTERRQMVYSMRTGDFAKGILDLVNENFKGKSRLTAIEIGSYQGESAELMLSTGVFDKIYCIDAWENGYDNNDVASITTETAEKAFDKRLGNDSRIVKVKGFSYNVADQIKNNSADFLYVDGCHTYEAVKKDLEMYACKVKKNGVIAGHDYTKQFSGLCDAVDEFLGHKPSKQFCDTSWSENKKNVGKKS